MNWSVEGLEHTRVTCTNEEHGVAFIITMVLLSSI